MIHLHFSMIWSRIMETSGLGSFNSWNTLLPKKIWNCSVAPWSLPDPAFVLWLLTPPNQHWGRIWNLRCICKSQHPSKTKYWNYEASTKRLINDGIREEITYCLWNSRSWIQPLPVTHHWDMKSPSKREVFTTCPWQTGNPPHFPSHFLLRFFRGTSGVEF